MGQKPPDAPDWWTTDQWATPQAVVDREAKRLGLPSFELDVCAYDVDVAKADYFWSPEDDGLKQDWASTNWCNPPHSDPAPWVQRASVLSKIAGCLTVMLLPPSTSTRWFHEYIWDHEKYCGRPKVQINFLPGRIRFLDWEGKPGERPRYDNMLVTFWPIDMTGVREGQQR